MRHEFADLVARDQEGSLSAPEAEAIAAHLVSCLQCRRLSIELRRNDGLLGLQEGDIELGSLPPASSSPIARTLKVALAASTIVVVAFAALNLGQFLTNWREEQAGSRPNAATGTAVAACSAPARPDYLPFASYTSTENMYGDGALGMRYSATNAPGQPVYVFVGRQRTAPSWAGTGRQVQAGSRAVQMIWVGDPGVGEISSYWTEGTGACTTFVASLVLRDRSASQIESELLRVVGSLPSAP